MSDRVRVWARMRVKLYCEVHFHPFRRSSVMSQTRLGNAPARARNRDQIKVVGVSDRAKVRVRMRARLNLQVCFGNFIEARSSRTHG